MANITRDLEVQHLLDIIEDLIIESSTIEEVQESSYVKFIRAYEDGVSNFIRINILEDVDVVVMLKNEICGIWDGGLAGTESFIAKISLVFDEENEEEEYRDLDISYADHIYKLWEQQKEYQDDYQSVFYRIS